MPCAPCATPEPIRAAKAASGPEAPIFDAFIAPVSSAEKVNFEAAAHLLDPRLHARHRAVPGQVEPRLARLDGDRSSRRSPARRPGAWSAWCSSRRSARRSPESAGSSRRSARTGRPCPRAGGSADDGRREHGPQGTPRGLFAYPGRVENGNAAERALLVRTLMRRQARLGLRIAAVFVPYPGRAPAPQPLSPRDDGGARRRLLPDVAVPGGAVLPGDVAALVDLRERLGPAEDAIVQDYRSAPVPAPTALQQPTTPQPPTKRKLFVEDEE